MSQRFSGEMRRNILTDRKSRDKKIQLMGEFKVLIVVYRTELKLGFAL